MSFTESNTVEQMILDAASERPVTERISLCVDLKSSGR